MFAQTEQGFGARFVGRHVCSRRMHHADTSLLGEVQRMQIVLCLSMQILLCLSRQILQSMQILAEYADASLREYKCSGHL